MHKNMQFKVFSRNLAENDRVVDANADQSHIWISIGNTYDDDQPQVHQNKFCRGILSLKFDDTDVEGWTFCGKEMMRMSDEQADEVLAFVIEHLGAIGLVCVHCEAGISRSAGCAEALSLLVNGHDSNIGSSSYYHPNIHVKTLLLKKGEGLRQKATELAYHKNDD